LIFLMILGEEYKSHVCTLPTYHPSSVPIFSSAPCSQTPPDYIFHLLSLQIVPPIKKHRQNYSFVLSHS
jgi:hypothetical protein